MNMGLLGQGLIVFRAVKFLFPERTYFFNRVSILMIYASSHEDLDVCCTPYRGTYN